MRQSSKLNVHGMWHVQIINDGKVDHDFMCPNGIVDEGIEYLLDTGFHNGTKLTPWYLGIINNISYTTLDDADVMTSHGVMTIGTARIPGWLIMYLVLLW